MVLYHGIGRPPLNRFYSPSIVNLQGEKHVFFMGKTQLVPAGYVVNKNGLGGVGVGPQQNRNSHMGPRKCAAQRPSCSGGKKPLKSIF